MHYLSAVLRSLRKEQKRMRAELGAIGNALSALTKLGNSNRRGTRNLSAAARRRIAAAQKRRWAKWKRNKAR
jgi:hypothetical protein